MINRIFFFDFVRTYLHGGALTTRKADGLNAIIDEWERKYANLDDRWLACALGTTHHETDQKMWPIEEYGRGKGKEYGQ